MTVTLCLYCSPDVGVSTVWKSTGNCIGGFRGPPRSVCPSLPHLVSNPLGVYWQLLRGFLRSPSVGCGLPYHISSLTPWESAGNCFGGFPRSPSVGCGLPYYIWSLLSGSLLATASGVSEVPLGRVWPSLPHLVSNVWKSAGNCIGGFRDPLSVGCGLPYHISSLTLWESAGNCSGTQTQLS